MSEKLTGAFILSAGGLLLAAALERLLIFLGNSPLLRHPDALLGIPVLWGVLLVGLAQLTIALVCLLSRSTRLSALLVLWLTSSYVVFRVGLMELGLHPDWTMIGALTDPLHLARGTSGMIAHYGVPGYLLTGSATALLWPWIRRKFPPRSAFSKMSCPSCGGHIKFAVVNLGRPTACPHCETSVRLRRPDENVKMSCYFCKGHIEFPAHALGTKMPCPHCRMDIALKEPA